MSTIATSTPVSTTYDRIEVERWPSEMPLFTAAVLIALPIYLLLTVSVIGLIYALCIAAFLFVLHVGFVSHVRGSGVRLAPDQFPELHARVELLAARMGLERMPEAYLMQAGGSINAFATRFLRSNMIVLFSDLLEACGSNEAARDMIIAHELGHIRAGHLRWRWLTAPAAIVPFLGTALSRAREYTCDRYGLAGAGDQDGALLGMTILAAGGKYGPQVNRAALVAQRAQLATGWMTIGEWLSTHPPLARRMVQLSPALGAGHPPGSGALRALGILLGAIVLIGTVSVGAVRAITAFGDLAGFEEEFGPTPLTADPLDVAADLDEIAAFLDAELDAGRALPVDGADLAARWEQTQPGPLPRDPFDGFDYGYAAQDGGFLVWSSGPDGQSGTPDDIVRAGPRS